MVGQNIGKYRVADRVGRGGMGTVYRAVDETLHREVAIKVLNAELNDPELARRFRAEAVTVARLNHPGIATIYELFQHEGQWLMVMEFVRGETFERMVERMGPISPQRAAEMCMQALAALAHAHSMGVVHRDLKPANLMITETGSVKIMDFGIARVAGTEHLTSAGYMMGTPAYMAPEQVLGQEIDARADLYAMGVVFYRLVTKALPFKGDTPFALAQSQVNEPPMPVGTLRPDLPPWVDQVIVRSLAKNPAERFQSAVEFHEGLARCLAGLPLTSTYSASAPTELMATPARAMPTGTIRTPSGMPTGPSALPTGPTAMPTGPATLPTGPTAWPTGPAAMPTAGAPSPSGAAAPAGSAATVSAASASMPPAGTTTAGSRPVAGSQKNLAILGGVAVGVIAMVAIAWWLWLRPAPEAPADAGPPTATETTAATPPAESAATSTDPAAAAGTIGASQGSQTAAPPAGSTPGAGSQSPAPSPAVTPQAAGASGAAASPPAAPTAAAPAPGRGTRSAAPAIDDSPLAFGDIRVVLVEGREGRDQEAQVRFGEGRIAVLPRVGGDAILSLEYSRVTQGTYVHARDPKWNAGAASPPADFNTPGTVFRRAAHWLVLQGPESFLILRLEDRNWERIVTAVEARTGITVARD
jgi:serine/threonine-protein kinase